MAHVWPLPKLIYRDLCDWEERRQVALVCTPTALPAVAERLSLPVSSRLEVTAAEEEHWHTLGAQKRG